MYNVSMRSRVTRKGQITIPANLRKQFHIEFGCSVEFEKTKNGIMVKPIKDLIDSDGELSEFASSDEMIKDLLRSRKNG